MGRVVNAILWPRYPREKDPGGGGPGLVWTGAENLTATGILSPYRLDFGEVPYRLSYPGLT
jgi:hypothetical protein